VRHKTYIVEIETVKTIRKAGDTFYVTTALLDPGSGEFQCKGPVFEAPGQFITCLFLFLTPF